MWTVGHKRDQVGGDVCKTHQQRGCWMFIHLWAPFYLHRQESSAWFRILWFTLATSWLPQAPQNYTCPTLDHYMPAIKSPAKSALVVLVGRWSSSLHRTWHQKLLWRIKAKILNVHFKCHHILQWGKENIGKPEKKERDLKIDHIKSYTIISSQDTNDFSESGPSTWKSRPSESFNRCWWAPIPHWKYIIRHMFLGQNSPTATNRVIG